MLNRCLDCFFEELHAATGNSYADGNDVKLFNLGTIALFSTYRLLISSGKHLEDNSHAHIVSLMYKLITSAKYTKDLSIGFDRDRSRRQRELTNKKNLKGNITLEVCLRIFLFLLNIKKGTFELGYKLIMTRISDNAVLNKDRTLVKLKLML